jgi:hypothetical protein
MFNHETRQSINALRAACHRNVRRLNVLTKTEKAAIWQANHILKTWEKSWKVHPHIRPIVAALMKRTAVKTFRACFAEYHSVMG